MRYKLTSNYMMSLRKDHATSAAKLAVMEQGKIAAGDEIWVAAQTTNSAKAGDQWLRVKEMDGQAVDGWMAVIHLGTVYSTLQDNGGATPPATPNDSLKRVIKAVVTYETESGATVTKEFRPES
ncbi:MAG: hypothetical protein Fur002_19570 [Anaerolineales bacterium]